MNLNIPKELQTKYLSILDEIYMHGKTDALVELKKMFEENINTVDYWSIKVDGSKTTQEVYEECKKLFPCHKTMDLTKIFDERSGSYTICFRKNIEADEELKNMSADELKGKGIRHITLKERLLLEIQYFKETGKHLDIDNTTLCAGSRYSNGGVPNVGWCSGKLFVDLCSTNNSHDQLRARRVAVC